MTAEAMAALHARAFGPEGRAWREEEFEQLLCSAHAFVIQSGDGFALGRVIADEAELLTIAVDPDRRCKGLGGRILTNVEREAAARGAARIFLEVAADNAAARALYLRAGYGQIACRAGYYRRASGPPADALILQKRLDA